MKDILVMLLSTFNNIEIKKSTATDEDDAIYEYYHQMEPVAHMLKRKSQLSTIVALCTKETFKSQSLMMDGECVNVSAVDYFKKVFNDIDIYFVLVEPESPTAGIIEATNKIRSLYLEDECRLWIDIHGGFRALQTIFQVVISLLEKEGIHSEKNYTVNGYSGMYGIKEESQSFDINYLFAGMNEFFNTGKADMLNKFISSRPANKNNEDLIKIINKISDSILLCDVDSFDNGCDEMSSWLSERKEDGSYIDIFAEYIKADYGKLLDKKKGITSKIEWCNEKEYLQQALTIIESKMPDKIYNSYILCTNTADTVVIKKGEKESKKSIKDLIDDTKPAWESRSNYLVMKYGYNKIVERDENNNIVYLELGPELNKIAEDTICNPCSVGGLNATFDMEDKKRNAYSVMFEYKRAADMESVFKLFMQLHMALKNQRNGANHGVSGQKEERVKAKDIKNAIDIYIKLARSLGID